MSKTIWTASLVAKKVKEVHNGNVTLNLSSFISIRNPAIFLDCDYGEWKAIPRNVIKGSLHPKKSLQKRKNTNLNKYGHECNLHSKEGIKKKKQTWINNLGVDNPSKSKKIKIKKETKSLQKFNCNNPSQNENIKCKIKNTCLIKYGETSHLKNKEIKEKIKKTLQDKYGVTNAFHTPKARENWKKPETIKKILCTFKKNHTFNSSKPEDRAYMILNNVFKKVERQKIINNWAIDFYIYDINLYIQIDGIYWHGLDRPINDIKKSNYKRDKIIYKKYKSDKKQNAYFKVNNLNLIRFTDLDIKNKHDNELLFIFKNLDLTF